MNNETIPTTPTLTIPLRGLSNDSLEQILEVLDREGSTIAQYQGGELDEIARHYDRQYHVALMERYVRKLNAAKIRQNEDNDRLLVASVSHNQAMQIPA